MAEVPDAHRPETTECHGGWPDEPYDQARASNALFADSRRQMCQWRDRLAGIDIAGRYQQDLGGLYEPDPDPERIGSWDLADYRLRLWRTGPDYDQWQVSREVAAGIRLVAWFTTPGDPDLSDLCTYADAAMAEAHTLEATR